MMDLEEEDLLIWDCYNQTLTSSHMETNAKVCQSLQRCSIPLSESQCSWTTTDNIFAISWVVSEDQTSIQFSMTAGNPRMGEHGNKFKMFNEKR